MDGNILLAFSFTLIAGLATGIGSIIALVVKRDNTKFLSISLGFSAGVMIYVSLMEILPKASDTLAIEYGLKNGSVIALIAFFGGMLFIGLIDKLIPEMQNPHEFYWNDEGNTNKGDLYKTGIFTALAVGIHNFPEGLATFVAALEDPKLAVPIVFAIAIHNIPEGIAVAVPIYHSTGSKIKAFLYSFLSGLAEPIGALIGFLLLMPFLTPDLLGIIFASVGGIMVFISFDQLLPAAEEYGSHHLSLYGLIAGMAVMAISLVMFL